MKLILSRKGLDSSFGPFPNPVLPNGRACWIPIPEVGRAKPGLPRYDELMAADVPLGRLVNGLFDGRLSRRSRVHLDPDLEASSHPDRADGWRPAFGQTGAAESHLRRYGVGPGDLFVFFGWFRQAERVRRRLRFVPGAPDLHVIYGWLQVGQRWDVSGEQPVPEGLRDHPHAVRPPYSTHFDAIYEAAPTLTGRLADGRPIAGAGTFDAVAPAHVLTEPGRNRSSWLLPADFAPGGREPLSYHASEDRWTASDDGVRLRAVSRGQEFVLDLDAYPGVERWVRDLWPGTTDPFAFE